LSDDDRWGFCVTVLQESEAVATSRFDSGIVPDPMEPTTVRVPPLPYLATVPTMLRRMVDERPDGEFIVTFDDRMTFAEADRRSRAVARHLIAHGAGKASRIGMMFTQNADWAVCFLGIARIGAIAVPMSTFYAPAELRTTLRNADAEHMLLPRTLLGNDTQAYVEAAIPELVGRTGTRHVFAGLPFLRHVSFIGGTDRPWALDLDPTADRHAEIGDDVLDAMEQATTPADLLVMVHTSGTTSDPKGVLHTHGTQVRHGANLAALRPTGRGDKVLAVMPFFWIGGLTCTFLPALHNGSTLLCMERVDPPTALDMIEREQPTEMMAWPTMRYRLMRDPSYAGRKINVSFLDPPGTPEVDPGLLHNSLGMSETSGPYAAAGREERTRVLPEEHRGSFGPRVPYTEHRLADPVTNETLPHDQEGEICVRGYSVMAGIYKREREETFDANGWYHTGDRGYFKDGYLFFTGRATEMIKTAGANVAPREVEVVLEAFPGVKLAFVCGVPDDERGEIPVAQVSPEAGATLDVDALLAHCRANLSSYKVPRRLTVVTDAEMPFLASGKLDRRTITSRWREAAR
jgi:acyl-CoA synthetase (AMP-forming)/AMP-acid ligase II